MKTKVKNETLESVTPLMSYTVSELRDETCKVTHLVYMEEGREFRHV